MQAGIYVAKDFFFGIELRIGEEPLTLKEDEFRIQEESFKSRLTHSIPFQPQGCLWRHHRNVPILV